MPVRTVLSLIPKHYYRTSVQRHIRCCGVLLQEPKKKESWFQQVRENVERWQVEEKKGKTWDQFKKELEEREEKKELDADGKEVVTLTDKIRIQFETRFPRLAQLFFSIRDGLSDLFSDFLEMVPLYFGLMRGTKDIHDFDLRQLELIYETFIQIRRMIPVLVCASLPFGNIMVLLAAYYRPLNFLSPHFFTPEQKATFIKLVHAHRIAMFLPVLQYLEVTLPEEDTSNLVSRFRELLVAVQDGKIPSPTELASFRDLFGGEQVFAMGKLSASQLGNLLILHGQRGFFMRTTWLDEWASYMHLQDRFIKRNGGVTSLSPEQLAKYCFQRGANANAMTEEEMQDYLRQWMAFSENISSDFIPLLLHAPAFFGFNHKSNQSAADQCDDSSL